MTLAAQPGFCQYGEDDGFYYSYTAEIFHDGKDFGGDRETLMALYGYEAKAD